MNAKNQNPEVSRPIGLGVRNLVTLSLAFATGAAAVDPLPRTTIMAMDGNVPLRGDGLFINLELPCLSDLGDVLFNGRLLSVGPVEVNGIFRSSGDTDRIETEVLQGDQAPDYNGFLNPSNSGRLQFNATSNYVAGMGLTDTADGNFDNLGLFQGGSSGDSLVQVARGNELVPNGDGQFLALYGSPASLNDADQVAFLADLRATAGGNSDNSAIYRFDEGSLTELVRKGARNPSDDGAFTNLNPGAQGVAINETGRVIFVGQSRLDPPYNLLTGGIYAVDDTKLKLLVRDGDKAPVGPGIFKNLTGSAPALGNGGGVAFRGSLAGTALETLDDTGVFRVDESDVVEVAREYAKVPGNNGRFNNFGSGMAVNTSGEVLFFATLNGATGGSDRGLFVGDGTTTRTVVRVNDRAPDRGRFIAFDDTIGAINDAGQVLFFAEVNLENGASTANGLFMLDPVYGMLEVAMVGDLLESAGLISSIGVTTGFGMTGLSARGFNESGQVAYRCDAGERNVIARWSPPRPPEISSVSLSDGKLVIRWSEFYDEAFLESKLDLSASGNWKKVLKDPTLIDGYYQTKLPITELHEFYRLNDPSSDPAE